MAMCGCSGVRSALGCVLPPRMFEGESACSPLHEKFRGCFLGALVGDCYGKPFELQGPKAKSVITEFLTERLSGKVSKNVMPHTGAVLLYTDDTEMARSVAESLIQKNGFDAKDMARRFTEEFFSLPKRGYGCFVRYVFGKLKASKYKNVFQPAAEQFKGSGSFGNGAAMRTYPVPLFCHEKSQETLIDICREVSRLTHAHQDGINGAIMLSLAIRWALEADSSQDFDPLDFLQYLQSVMEGLEAERPPVPGCPSFCTKLENIRESLKDEIMDPTELGRNLGTDVIAVLSVPTAIYCFLRSQKPLKDFQTNNPFLRTLFLAISLGGDTDTVATMACALSGAFHGEKAVPEVLFKQCEAWEEIYDKAERMAALVGVKK